MVHTEADSGGGAAGGGRQADYCRGPEGGHAQVICGMWIAHVERALRASMLERSNGNQTHAADMLGLNRNTLRAKLAKYKLI